MTAAMGGDTDPPSCDGFLGGRVRLWQPRAGYRAGIDPVLLAASVPARPGQSVLDLGCGVGAASLCLAARVPGLVLTGVELQPHYTDLARRNASENRADLTVHRADLAALPDAVRQVRFDHVIANPPYYRPGAHSGARDSGRRLALGEVTPLDLWIDMAARRLAPGGYLHVIQRIERVPDLLAACLGRLGALELLPLAARVGRAPTLALLRARKGGRADFVLHSPLVLHSGDRHRQGQNDYRPEIEAILREGAALTWPVPR